MNCGDIHYFSSQKARGHAQRNKYHVYICEAGQGDDGDHIFLFINKSNSYGDGFEIRKAEGYDFLPLEFSFVSCSTTVAYHEDEVEVGDPVGRLRNEDVEPLIAHVEQSATLEEREIHTICASLRGLLRRAEANRPAR